MLILNVNKFDVEDIVIYNGSDDEWNHECCIGAEYEVVKVYPSLCGISYYDLKTTVEDYDFLRYDFYREIWSVLKYFLKNNKYNIKYLSSSINPEWDLEPRSQDADKFWSNIFMKQKKFGVNVEEMDGNYIISLK